MRSLQGDYSVNSISYFFVFSCETVLYSNRHHGHGTAGVIWGVRLCARPPPKRPLVVPQRVTEFAPNRPHQQLSERLPGTKCAERAGSRNSTHSRCNRAAQCKRRSKQTPASPGPNPFATTELRNQVEGQFGERKSHRNVVAGRRRNCRLSSGLGALEPWPYTTPPQIPRRLCSLA
jgi:hypothetical protein